MVAGGSRERAHHDEDDGIGVARAVVIVEERVPGAGVLLDIVIHAEQRIRALLESAPDAMVIVDRAGTIKLVNAQTETLFGYPREELIGCPVGILVPGRFRTAHPVHRRE